MALAALEHADGAPHPAPTTYGEAEAAG
jgi:hypothetical protein